MPMMKKAFIAAMTILLLIGIGFMVQFGLRPRPIKKISLSSFDTAGVMANSIALRLREEIKANPLLIVGLSAATEQIEIVQSLFAALKEPEMKYESLVVDPHAVSDPMVFGLADVVDVDRNFVQLGDPLKAAIQANKRVVVIVPTVFSPQIQEGTFADRLKKQFGLSPMSLTLSVFARRRDQEAKIPIACVVPGVDKSGTGKLGCQILQAGRLHYRKKMPLDKYTGLVNQIGMKDYLVLFTKETPTDEASNEIGKTLEK